jgi:hypothetical protein
MEHISSLIPLLFYYPYHKEASYRLLAKLIARSSKDSMSSRTASHLFFLCRVYFIVEDIYLHLIVEISIATFCCNSIIPFAEFFL